ncbi:unnamed protein product [Didymodactylos carnosus]|uniref:Uncharacterized protein n=1 Tax=Didymodactylos carnosus TaxID=1234261 RepID=A0A815RPP2_9BILA|nr:unnamed protein product [Didymodactylos carnosus]CAF1500860.1 unnamed protein product [Didymodactylos carnosus]CAF4289414.1 unnamed protein product [Didymodactylos carnosus]CAF4345931.1 unnamed protein product [Didymodactylos carnosus]
MISFDLCLKLIPNYSMCKIWIKTNQILWISFIFYLISLYKNVRSHSTNNDSFPLLNKASFFKLLQNGLKHPYSSYDISTLDWKKQTFKKWQKQRQVLIKHCKHYRRELTFRQCLLMYEFWLEIDEQLTKKTCPIGDFELFCPFSQVRVAKNDTQQIICKKIMLTDNCLLRLHQNGTCQQISPMSDKYKQLFQHEFQNCSIIQNKNSPL